ncbi:MAG TPA: hypothetical protein VGV69_05575 [Solirubrobacterales bacterium]|nr:hypothetical protein [Solirubrobacterales bacterium]
MILEIALIVLLVVAAIGEWYVYDRAIWWHDDKRDPRNFPPPQ